MSNRPRAPSFAAVLTLAVGAVAGVVARMTVLMPMAREASTVEARLGATLVVVLGLGVAAVLLAALTAVPLYGTVSERVRTGDVPRLVAVCLVAVCLVGVGFVGVQPIAGEFADATVETRSAWGGPDASFTATERTTDDGERLVTITHDGGDPVLASAVVVLGEGFADVDAADQTGPGRWGGEATDERPRRGGRAIVTGDAVTVGASEDCEIALVYERDGHSSTFFFYECAAADGRPERVGRG